MHSLNDIIVWKTKVGMTTITSCFGELKIAEILNNKVVWFAKEKCTAEVIAWVEGKAGK